MTAVDPRLPRLRAAIRRPVAEWRPFGDVLAYSTGLTAGGTVFAAFVVDAGHASLVGVLATIAGIVNLVSRWTLLWALRRWSSQAVMNVSALIQLASFGLPIVGAHPFVLAVSSAGQGWSRAWYWTTSNAQVAKSSDAGGKVATVSLMSSLGSVLAPVLLVLATGFEVALLLSALVNVFAVRRTTPPERRPVEDDAGPETVTGSEAPLPVSAAPGTGFSVLGGAYHCVVYTFVPALAVLAGLGTDGLGALLFAASILGVLGVVLVRREAVGVRGAACLTTALAVPVGAWAYATSTTVPVLVVFALAAAIGRMVFTTLGPVAVATLLPPRDRTRGMVVSGTARSIALFVFPAAVAGVDAFTSLPVAVVVATVLTTVASLVFERIADRRADRGGSERPPFAAPAAPAPAPVPPNEELL